MEQTKITHAGMEIQEIPAQGGEPTRWQVTVPETGERVSTPSGLDAAKRIAENERKVIERSGTLAQRTKAAEEALAAEERARTEAKKARSAATAGKSLAEIKAMDHMNRTIRVGGEDMKAHEFVDARLAAGDTPKMELVDRVAPMSRTAFNRASNAEQRAHEAKVKAGGKKETYWLGGYGLSKTEYDYAVKKAAAQENTRAEPQPAPTAPAGGGRIEGMEQMKAPPKPEDFANGAEYHLAVREWRSKYGAKAQEPSARATLVMDLDRKITNAERRLADRRKARAGLTPPAIVAEAIANIEKELADLRKQRQAAAQQENTRTDPQPATAAPAGGGRIEGVEQTKGEFTQSLAREPASWVIREKATGKVVMETFDRKKVDALNTEKYEAVPALQHLQELNRATKENTRAPQEVTQQASVPAEPQDRTGGREAAEAGAGDRAQRAAEGGGQGVKKEGGKQDPAAMTAFQINKELDALDAEQSAVVDAMIEAGRGNERPSDYAKKTDPLSARANAQFARRSELRREMESRYGPDVPERLPKKFGPRTKQAAKPTGKALSPAEVKAEVKAEFQRQIDAVPRFGDGGPETITLRAGGSSVKLQNTGRRVAEYMKALDTVKGGKTPKPVSEKTDLRGREWLGGTGKRAPLAAIKDMIDDLDPQAAVDFAAAQGIDLEVALKGDRARLNQVRGLKPTPDTPAGHEVQGSGNSPEWRKAVVHNLTELEPVIGGSRISVRFDKPVWQLTWGEVADDLRARGLAGYKDSNLPEFMKLHYDAQRQAAAYGQKLPDEALFEKPRLVRDDLTDNEADLALDHMADVFRKTKSYAKAVDAYRRWPETP